MRQEWTGYRKQRGILDCHTFSKVASVASTGVVLSYDMKEYKPKYILNVQLEWQVAEKLDIVARHLKVKRSELVRQAIDKFLVGYRIKGQEEETAREKTPIPPALRISDQGSMVLNREGTKVLREMGAVMVGVEWEEGKSRLRIWKIDPASFESGYKVTWSDWGRRASIGATALCKRRNLVGMKVTLHREDGGLLVTEAIA